jgi:hypothetical protein
MSDERPEPRRRGGGGPEPRPAPDEHEDPIHPSSGRAGPSDSAEPVKPRFRRGPQTVAQLNTRVDPILNDLVAEVSEQRGWTKREVVEHALKAAYKAEYRALSS